MLEFLETFDSLIHYAVFLVMALFASFEKGFEGRVTNLLLAIVILLIYISDKL